MKLPYKSLRLPVKALDKIGVDLNLYMAGRHAGARDAFLIRAHSTDPKLTLTRSVLMREARTFHRQYWQAMQRVRALQLRAPLVWPPDSLPSILRPQAGAL